MYIFFLPSDSVKRLKGRSHPVFHSFWKFVRLLEPSRTTYQNRVSPSRALRGGSENIWVRYPASKTRRAINLRRCRPVEDPALDGTVSAARRSTSFHRCPTNPYTVRSVVGGRFWRCMVRLAAPPPSRNELDRRAAAFIRRLLSTHGGCS